MLTAALEVTAAWPEPVVLTVAAALLVTESGALIGIAIPGTSVLVGLGLWSHVAPQALAPAVVVAAAAPVAGAHLGWWQGRRGTPVGRPGGLLERPRRFATARAAQAGCWLADRGTVATIAVLACGHWASAARMVMPRVAGAADAPYRVVGPVLVLSGSAWATTLVLLGNRIGPLVLTSATALPLLVVALVIGALVLHGSWAARSR